MELLLLFQTNIRSIEKVKYFEPIFNEENDIIEWTIDTEDIDNVLRIKATKNLTEDRVVELVQKHGYYIEPMAD